MKKKNRAILVFRDSYGNSFGDRVFLAKVEIRNEKQEVIDTHLFEETALEGEHSTMKKYVNSLIKSYAKEFNAVWTGEY